VPCLGHYHIPLSGLLFLLLQEQLQLVFSVLIWSVTGLENYLMNWHLIKVLIIDNALRHQGQLVIFMRTPWKSQHNTIKTFLDIVLRPWGRLFYLEVWPVFCNFSHLLINLRYMCCWVHEKVYSWNTFLSLWSLSTSWRKRKQEENVGHDTSVGILLVYHWVLLVDQGY
jgi:hypothetical protein